MLDIQFIRDNAELVERACQLKNIKIDIKALLEADVRRRELTVKTEDLRRARNEQTASIQGQRPSDEQVEQGKRLKEAIAKSEADLQTAETTYQDLLMQVPNIIPDDTPEGGEDASVTISTWGKAEKRSVKDHLEWGEANGLIDFERATKVAGNKFYYLKGSLVELELAVFQLGLKIAGRHGFIPMTVPHLVNTRIATGTGFLPRGEERQIYTVEDTDLSLIATAEIPITGYHADEILDAKNLPILYAGLSPAYRMEAGAYGKHSKGLYRVHQFNKLELYVFCTPEESENWHKKLVAIEEELCQALEIPYRIIRIASGDLGAPAYKKFDIEYWSAGEGTYRELMSCSNVTDYQARRLNIRYRTEDGKTAYAHTLNGTAAAFSRVAIAIIENLQDEHGVVRIPAALQGYMDGKTTL